MAPRYSLAAGRASALLRKARVRSLPVEVERLAELVGATIHYEPLANEISGMVYRQPHGKSVIGVNSAHPTTRQRFTIAHEVGHLLLHKDDDLHVDETFPMRFRDADSSLAVNEQEIESNHFAAELLMPADLLQKEIDRLPPDTEMEDAVKSLANLCEVSEQAISIRLSRLGVLP